MRSQYVNSGSHGIFDNSFVLLKGLLSQFVSQEIITGRKSYPLAAVPQAL